MSWHEGERATVVGGIIIASFFLCVYIGLVLHVWDFSTLTTYKNQPLATDFSSYWYASKLALSGKPALVYDPIAMQGVQEQAFGPHLPHRTTGWFYPPFFLFAALPLALVPYLPAFLIFIFSTLVLYLMVLSRLSPQKILLPLCVLFPGTYENFIFGQNGFISGALLGGGLLLLDSSPLVSGCLLGLLSYKPTLAILTFAALIFGRYWKALISAGATVLLISLLSLAAFGSQTWFDYLRVMSFPMKQLENGSAPIDVAATFFAAILAAGFGVKAAYLVQGLVMLVVVAGVAWVWRSREMAISIRGAVLVLGTLLFTPYAFVYDLAILALPLCWLWEEGRRHGRRPGELLLLLLGWLAPFAAAVLYKWLALPHGNLQIGPVILLALFFLALQKAKDAINRSSASERLR